MDYLNDKLKNTFIKLIVSVVKREKVDIDTLVDINKIIAMAKYHSLENVIYDALIINEINVPTQFSKLHDILVYQTVVQNCELISICEELNKNEIHHLPLKGSVIRKYYPKEELRSMADLDILIKEEKLKQVNDIMINLGYETESLGGNHDTYMKKPYMNVEMHRAMVDDLYHTHEYYKNIWDKVISIDKSYTYYLTDEDFYIFMIIHGGKHFSKGGTGLRILLDIYYFTLGKKDLDFEYINTELEKTGYKVFSDKLLQLTKCLFYDIELDDDMRLLLDFIVECGTYGTLSNVSTIGVIQKDKEDLESGKKKYIFRRLFPTMKVMKKRNPILNKVPILLPWFYCTRLLKGLFSIKKYKNEVKDVNSVDEKRIQRVTKIQEITKVRN